MPPSQSLISIYLMSSFCSFIITPWFDEIPNNLRQFLLQDKERMMVQLWRCWTMVWWNWITLMEPILLSGKSNWLGFEEVFKWWIDLNEDSVEQGLKKQSFIVGKTRWWFFHIADALKAMLIVWTLKVQISCSWAIWISNWLMSFFVRIFACVANLYELRNKNELLTCLNVIKWSGKSKWWEFKPLKW